MSVESKWGLGLEHLDDMPDENTYNFGLVSLCPLSSSSGDTFEC